MHTDSQISGTHNIFVDAWDEAAEDGFLTVGGISATTITSNATALNIRFVIKLLMRFDVTPQDIAGLILQPPLLSNLTVRCGTSNPG
jgi:hypothetical protein